MKPEHIERPKEVSEELQELKAQFEELAQQVYASPMKPGRSKTIARELMRLKTKVR